MTPRLHAEHRRLLHVFAVVSLALTGGACKRDVDTDAGPKLNVLLPELSAASEAREQNLQLARTELRLANGSSVTTCEAYLSARKSGVQVAEETDAQMVASEYLICDGLQALSTAAALPASSASDRGRQLADRLDLRSFPSSRGPRLDEDAHTLQALGDPIKITATEAAVEDATWSYRLQVAAEADFDRDGKPDWLVWLSDEARDGNYRGYSTLIVAHVDRPGPLVAKVYQP